MLLGMGNPELGVLMLVLFIVFIMLFVPSLCEDPPEPDWGSPEEFLKEVNEYRAK